MDKNKATNEYDDAIASGSGAYLLQQSSPGTLSCSIGNLPPHTECIVKITYVTELQTEEDKIKFILPTSVAPLHKNTTNVNHIFEGLQTVTRISNGLTINLKLAMASNITDISSPTHPLSLDLDGKNAVVQLGNEVTDMDQDFIILISTCDPFTPRLWVDNIIIDGKEQGYVSMAIFSPIIVPSYPKAEFIFVIDRSGSMHGQQIEDAKSALQILLRSIPEGSKFNIIGFESTFTVMFTESVIYNESTFEAARNMINSMTATLGGTNLKDPLNWIFRQRADFDYPRQVFVLTDGQLDDNTSVFNSVKNCSGYEINPRIKAAYDGKVCTYTKLMICSNIGTQQHWYMCNTCNLKDNLGLCAVCKVSCHAGHEVTGPYFSEFFCDCAESTTHPCKTLYSPNPNINSSELYRSSTRVFSLGIGSSVSRELVSGLAKLGGGTAVFVKSGEKMEKKIVGQLKLSMQPSLTGVKIAWPMTCVQSPQDPPPIFNRSRLIVYSTSQDPPTDAKLNAFADCKVTVSSELQAQKCPEDGLVQLLAAKARIRDLEDSINIDPNEIIKTSTEYQVLSSHTALVAIEERGKSVEGTMQKRKIVASKLHQPPFQPQQQLQQQQPSIAFGVSVPSHTSLFLVAPTSSSFSIAAHAHTPYMTINAPIPTTKHQLSMRPSRSGSRLGPRTVPASSINVCVQFGEHLQQQAKFNPHQQLSALMQLQTFNGSWNLDEPFACAVGVTLVELNSAKPPLVSPQVWATAVGIAFLELKLSTLRDAWEMVTQKSVNFIGPMAGFVLPVAKKLLFNNTK